MLIDAGLKEQIHTQRVIFQNHGRDSAALIRRGVETALLNYPARYTRSLIETVAEQDLNDTTAVLVAFVLAGPSGKERSN